MDNWSPIFAEKFYTIFKVYVRTDRGEGGQKSLKIKCADILYRWPLEMLKWKPALSHISTGSIIIKNTSY